ncbi:MAG: thioredoxin family protein [Opitutaceae bacterium]|nr:thioredoxin family protein [Opitutaceae bacterium]
MRCSLSLLLSGCILAAAPVSAVERGDTYDAVIAEKGSPLGTLNAGTVQILKYRDQEIRLEGGVVVSLRAVRKAIAASVKPAIAPVTPPLLPPPELQWTDSFPEAVKLARDRQRQVFMFFTGSDWCEWCKRLDAEVLSTPEFARYAADKFVLLKLDFPHNVQQPEDLSAQNRALAKRFRVDGFPTMIVFSSDGKRLANLGYEPGGPAPFIEKLSGLK